MITRIDLMILFLATLTTASAQSNVFRKTEWTVAEVKAWVNEQKPLPSWHGSILYQGSDSSRHHFISRVMDEWIWFKIKREELMIAEEKNFRTDSSAPFGYYYVDASSPA